MVDGLDCGNPSPELRRAAFDVLEQLGLGVGRSRDQDYAGIANRCGNAFEELLIFRCVSAADDTGFVVQMTGRTIRVHRNSVGLCRIEMKDAGLTMVNPDDRMIVGCHGLLSRLST